VRKTKTNSLKIWRINSSIPIFTTVKMRKNRNLSQIWMIFATPQFTQWIKWGSCMTNSYRNRSRGSEKTSQRN